MSNPDQLRYLLNLLDDDSHAVQEEITQRLLAFGPQLRQQILKLPSQDFGPRLKEIKKVLERQQQNWLREHWSGYFKITDRQERLEYALSLIADFQNGMTLTLYPQESLKSLLDQLALEFTNRNNRTDPFALANFLFKDKQIKGNEQDYYNPSNSNLVYVITEKKGLPISLACIYMFVGARLGLNIGGCNFPGHFMARVEWDGEKYLIDGYNKGSVIRESDIKQLNVSVTEVSEDVLKNADADVIILRILANLIQAYKKVFDIDNQELMMELYKQSELKEGEDDIVLSPEVYAILTKEPGFKPGQLVKHKQYGYHGIIVDFDTMCQADDTWYFSNQTQPERNQAWYHVLVHGSEQVTYTAESNLLADQSKRDIDHPLVDHFFSRNKDGIYVRNKTPWPDWE